GFIDGQQKKDSPFIYWVRKAYIDRSYVLHNCQHFPQMAKRVTAYPLQQLFPSGKVRGRASPASLASSRKILTSARRAENPNKKGWVEAVIDEVLGDRIYFCKLVKEDLVWKRHLNQIIKGPECDSDRGTENEEIISDNSVGFDKFYSKLQDLEVGNKKGIDSVPGLSEKPNVNLVNVNKSIGSTFPKEHAIQKEPATDTKPNEDLRDKDKITTPNSPLDELKELAKPLNINTVPKIENDDSPNSRPRESTFNLSKAMPIISLPTFSGKYDEWNAFIDLFTVLVDKNEHFSPAQKFIYLKTHLAGEPLTEVREMLVTDDNYKTALDLLKKRYSNKLVIINSDLKALIETPNVTKGDASNLRRFLSHIKQHINSLKSLKVPVDTWDLMLIYLLSHKLDFRTHQSYELEKPSNDLPKLVGLIDFIEKRCTALENVTVPDTKYKPRLTHVANTSHETKTILSIVVSSSNRARIPINVNLYKITNYVLIVLVVDILLPNVHRMDKLKTHR
ncbi:hypothetical protein NQ317_011342, partial [Molorchus minor]